MSMVLVFGGNGQLGQCLQEVVKDQGSNGLNYKFLSTAEGDITNDKKLTLLFQENQPSYIINCAAYTAVDIAEDEGEKAKNINTIGAGNLAKLCGQYGTTLIHISTDFVFDGSQSFPLKETDATNPLGIYGVTKLAGEQSIAENCDRYFIIRTSWLYSTYGKNFLKTMLRLAQNRNTISVVSDQIGTPTYAMDLAGFILHLIDNNANQYGVYHFSNQGVASWYDFASEILKNTKTIAVVPVNSDAYPTRAIRPAFSVLDKNKIKNTFSYNIPYWRDSVEKCLLKLNASL
ncbi:dTDP-4-dehydrorhamnose reductase [Nonlabens sp. Hel1_33_55]|uniref:dTDP-4-dehydrorhamnose reductase n=1 Tax=Nonlabens sp. Hel1_33_55 TaxID=1336802 RepID=UPI000875BC31|nr:dTDP-4-dehydrorhamnose reductase [Nonlabens sp. Hel1_33_55]SCX94014.1 dTDP-4-dehydrorhamnose reductase [Nonlabens sp. Hel1_33_55]